MWKIVVFTVLVVAHMCAAQPARPEIAETFQASGNVEAHEGPETRFGRFFWAEDVTAEAGEEASNYTNGNGSLTQDFKRLVRLDMGKEFFYSNDSGRESCTIRDITTIEPIWEWVKDATFRGNITIKHVVYDQWTFGAAGIHFDLAVKQDNPNVPVQLVTQMKEITEKKEFITFNAITPKSADFNIPDACKSAMQRKQL